MKYEVSYLSKSGNTTVLAEAIVSMLPPEDTRITDLALEETSGGADVNFIGFDVESDTVPLKIMDALDYAEGKSIALFATCGLIPTEEHKTVIERKIYPFLPDECDYKGLFLCAGQLPKSTASVIEEKLKTQPDNEEMKEYLKRHYQTTGHPNTHDIEDLATFVLSILNK